MFRDRERFLLLKPGSGLLGRMHNQFLKKEVCFISSPVTTTSDSEDKSAACQTLGGGKMNCESPKILLHLICIKFLLSEQLNVCLYCFSHCTHLLCSCRKSSLLSLKKLSFKRKHGVRCPWGAVLSFLFIVQSVILYEKREMGV